MDFHRIHVLASHRQRALHHGVERLVHDLRLERVTEQYKEPRAGLDRRQTTRVIGMADRPPSRFPRREHVTRDVLHPRHPARHLGRLRPRPIEEDKRPQPTCARTAWIRCEKRSAVARIQHGVVGLGVLKGCWIERLAPTSIACQQAVLQQAMHQPSRVRRLACLPGVLDDEDALGNREPRQRGAHAHPPMEAADPATPQP